MSQFFFGVYPYICLVAFTLGLIFRYLATPGEWNARSSNLFSKTSLARGSFVFHYTIIMVFFGHVIGLLIPPNVLAAVGFSGNVHMAVASFCGKVFVILLFYGAGALLWRHFKDANVRATTVAMDIVILGLILFQAFTGGWQDFVTRANVFGSVGSWVRGVLCGSPEPMLMANVPWAIKIHVVTGFTIIGLIPFSRLVHFISIPVIWFARPAISYRKRYENL